MEHIAKYVSRYIRVKHAKQDLILTVKINAYRYVEMESKIIMNVTTEMKYLVMVAHKNVRFKKDTDVRLWMV